jgi:hypothetical protein
VPLIRSLFRIMRYFVFSMVSLLLAAGAAGQSVPIECGSGDNVVEACLLTGNDTSSSTSQAGTPPEVSANGAWVVPGARITAPIPAIDYLDAPAASPEGEKEKFHWRRALEESFTFLAIEQAWVVHTDFRWVVSENGIPFNHYWRDYKQSLSTWWQAGWSAGENPMYNYVGHPIQGAMTSYIEIQNDPKSRNVEFSKSKAYWGSRLKATLWNGIYSTQWSIGPLSEMTVEKYGSKDRPPWNANNTFPCDTKTCYWGVGKVNLVMTPVGGLGWLVAEDWMDKHIVRRVEGATRSRFLVDTVRCTFNPIHAGANILYGNRPWFRDRDTGDWDSAAQH